ncbi:MAG: hypothetical protein AAFW69_03810, partial [Pseudomonadota bacterium]
HGKDHAPRLEPPRDEGAEVAQPVLRYTPSEDPALMRSSCAFVATDDDGLGNLGSLVARRFEAGGVILAVRAFGTSYGPVTLGVAAGQ